MYFLVIYLYYLKFALSYFCDINSHLFRNGSAYWCQLKSFDIFVYWLFEIQLYFTLTYNSAKRSALFMVWRKKWFQGIGLEHKLNFDYKTNISVYLFDAFTTDTLPNMRKYSWFEWNGFILQEMLNCCLIWREISFLLLHLTSH